MTDLAALKEILTYSPETGEFTWTENAKNKHKGKAAGHFDSRGYRKIQIGRRRIRAHRLAWLFVHGEMPELIDHINGELDDNRICNLRLATVSQNLANSKLRVDNTSGYKGVCQTPSGRWRAVVNVRKRSVYLGLFDTPVAAHTAYVAAAKEHHGEFARPA